MSSHRGLFNTEYWVPAGLTKNQLKKYCKILEDESNILCTQSKESSFREGLRNILSSTRKCSIHSSIEAKGQNVEIAGSGKLNLLGMMLKEINKRSLKVLIFYEEISCTGRRIGEILGEFLRQTFGSDSYENVGSEPISTRTPKFNAYHKKFVYLVEKKSCYSVLSLSSVSIVLIFNNDWSPKNSINALERIKLDSQPEQIKIFRLYSPFTVEENILFFAREKKRIDSLQRMSWVTCHTLLMRGAGNLFRTLSELNCDKTPVSSASTMSEKSVMSDIVQLLQNSEGTGTTNLSVILKVQAEGSYYMSSQMPIELLEISQEDYTEPSNYWNKLLKGKHTPEVVSERVIKKRKVDKGSSAPFEQVFQDERTPISTAAQLQDSSAALLFKFEKEIEEVQTQYVNKAQELHSELELKLNKLCTNSTMVLRSMMPADPFPENDATTTPQSPPAEPLLQALRAFHDGMCQDMDRRIRAFHDEMRQDMDRRMRASQDEMRQQISSMETRMVQQSDKCTRRNEKDFGAEDDEEGADPAAADDTLPAFPDEMHKQVSSMETGMAQQSDACPRSAEEGAEDDEEGADPTAADDTLTAFPDEMHKQVSSMETRMAQQSDACTCSAEEGAEDDEEGADPTAADDTLTAFPDEVHKQISSMETRRMAQQSDACTRSAEEGAEDNEEGADPTTVDDTLTAFPDEMRKQMSSMETRMAQQSDACTRSAEEGAEDDEEGADPTAADDTLTAFPDEMHKQMSSMSAVEGAGRTAADDTLTASRHNLLDNMGDSPCPCSYGKKLLILDVNGLLLAFRPTDKKKEYDTAIWRPYFKKFLQFCFEKFDVAVWSSRTKDNLGKLIQPLNLADKNLIFCWDQRHCTKTDQYALDCPSKPLFLKDLRKVWKKYEAYNAANTLLLDDSPYKALVNPANTAIFPVTFQHSDDEDTSLGPGGDLYTYLKKLAMAENVQKYVEQNPFGQRAITESDPNWKFYSEIIKTWS